MATVRQYDGDNAIERWRHCDDTTATVRYDYRIVAPRSSPPPQRYKYGPAPSPIIRPRSSLPPQRYKYVTDDDDESLESIPAPFPIRRPLAFTVVLIPVKQLNYHTILLKLAFAMERSIQ
ncbi:hypothetical protein DPMN_092422, partial [Dreissena polymorpha]